MKLQSCRPYFTAYYPDSSLLEGGYEDSHGHPLCTLESFLAGDAPHVSVAMDLNAFPWGTYASIPDFDIKYGRQIVFRICDTGSAFIDAKTDRADICVATKAASLDNFLNGRHSLVALLLK